MHGRSLAQLSHGVFESVFERDRGPSSLGRDLAAWVLRYVFARCWDMKRAIGTKPVGAIEASLQV